MRTLGSYAAAILVAGSLSAQIQIVGPVPVKTVYVAPTTFSPMLLDTANNGIDVSGNASTSLITGAATTTKWTKPGSDDAFLVINATGLRNAGYDITRSNGTAAQGLVLVTGGLRVRVPGATESVPVSNGWGLLSKLDGNSNGKLDSSDPAFQSMAVWVDQNADGAIGSGELQGLFQSTTSITIVAGAVMTEPSGAVVSNGTYVRANGTIGRLASIVAFGS